MQWTLRCFAWNSSSKPAYLPSLLEILVVDGSQLFPSEGTILRCRKLPCTKILSIPVIVFWPMTASHADRKAQLPWTIWESSEGPSLNNKAPQRIHWGFSRIAGHLLLLSNLSSLLLFRYIFWEFFPINLQVTLCLNLFPGIQI